MIVKMMYNGIKCDKTLIKGIFYLTGDGRWCFVADRSIALQFMDKRALPYQESAALEKELQNEIGSKVINDSDAMTDYFDDDRIYFPKNSRFYNDIANVQKEKRRKNILKDIAKYEQALTRGGNRDFWEKQITNARRRLAELDE